MLTPECLCKNCNNYGRHAVKLNARGQRNAYLCNFHYYNAHDYFTENEIRLGTIKKNGFTYSQELESSFSNEKARIELMKNGYIPTEDSTVDIEYKSAITYGLNSLSKHCDSIQALIDNGDLSLKDTWEYTVGTHLHIGHIEYINPHTMQLMKRFYHELFLDLCKAMEKDYEKTEKLFGRYFGNWARKIKETTYCNEHTNFINMQHDYTVEFRLCKFINAKQYMTCVWFCRNIMETVIKNFIEHENKPIKDARRYKDRTSYLEHKAKVTSEKLVKMFESLEIEY